MTKTNKDGFTPILILLIIVLVLGSVGFLVFKTTKINPSPTATPSPAETSVKRGNPTTDWKTYRNENWGITFRYPEIESRFQNKIVLKESKNIISVADVSHNLVIYFKKIPNNNIQQRIAKILAENVNSRDLGQSKFNGYDSHEVVEDSPLVWAPNNSIILLQKDGDVIEVGNSSGFSPDDYDILSTFKFTN